MPKVYFHFDFVELVTPEWGSSVLLCTKLILFISFVCPKETNQRKGQPQIIFGINIFSAAYALQLVSRFAGSSNSNAGASPTLHSLENANLFPKIIWWHFSPYGDLVFVHFLKLYEAGYIPLVIIISRVSANRNCCEPSISAIFKPRQRLSWHYLRPRRSQSNQEPKPYLSG
jgi:hypothetical protein